MIKLLIKLAEKGILPDFFIRLGISKLCGQRLTDANDLSLKAREEKTPKMGRHINGKPYCAGS